MRLSTKGRYGLRLMIDLGVFAKERQVSLRSISDRLDISESYLEQLIAKLKKDNLVIGIRGAQGGYILGIDPRSISVGNILRALEGSLAPTDCTCGDIDYSCIDCCANSGICVTKSVWEKIRDGINQVVDNITLKDLIDDYEREGNSEAINFL